jgi:hypothetical protein
MKTIIILTDEPDGSVNIQYLNEMTTDEVSSSMPPEQSRGYQLALSFHDVTMHAKALEADLRAMHAEAVEKHKEDRCLH